MLTGLLAYWQVSWRHWASHAADMSQPCHWHVAWLHYASLSSLPEQLQQLDITFRQFKRSLKTFMFG